jgi:hypothetical protein
MYVCMYGCMYVCMHWQALASSALVIDVGITNDLGLLSAPGVCLP